MNNGDAGRVIARAGDTRDAGPIPVSGGEGPSPVHCLRNTIIDGWSPGQGELLHSASTNTAMTLLSSCFIAKVQYLNIEKLFYPIYFHVFKMQLSHVLQLCAKV